MFPMRLKIGPSRNNEWRCFFCLHVRTATTLLGIWHLMLHVLALSVLALLMRNHHDYYDKNMVHPQQEYENILPTPLSKSEDIPYYLPQDGNNRIHEADMDMSALMTVCTLAITLLLVYGTVKGKASHLLPFFCLQLFDFAIATLTATGYFVYLRSVHNFVKEHWHNMPFFKELLQLSPQWLSVVVISTFFMCMMWKAYCINIVWRCYKYLTLRQQATHSTVHYILPGDGNDRVPEPDYSSLLPDYEAACASAMKQPPPPSYQAAMASQLPSYPEAIHVVTEDEVPVHNIHRIDQSSMAQLSVNIVTIPTIAVPTLAIAASNVVAEQTATTATDAVVEESEASTPAADEQVPSYPEARNESAAATPAAATPAAVATTSSPTRGDALKEQPPMKGNEVDEKEEAE